MASSVVGVSAANAGTSSTPWSENFDAMTTYSGVDFDGNVTSLVTDQPAGEGYTSGKAIKLLSQTVAWAGTKFVLPTTTNLISAENATATLSVYSPDAEDRCFQVKLENSANTGINTGDTNFHVSQGWQTLTFDFSSKVGAGKTYNVVALMPDFFGVGCNMVWNANNKPLTTWYVDNISFPGATTSTVDPLPVGDTPSLFNFEGDGTTGYADPFGGAIPAIDGSAPAGGSVGSTNALKITHVSTAAGWAGVTFGWKDTTLISAANPTATANIYAPVAGQIINLKVENGANGGLNKEVQVTSVQGWHKYSFTFTGIDASVVYGKAAIFVNFNGPKSETEAWYVDDVAFAGATSAPLVGADTPSLFNFEGDGTTGYVDGFGGETAAIVTDAPAGGSVGSTKAMKITDNGWAPWAGVTYGWHDTTLISASNATATANIYAPAAGLPIVLKVENGANPGLNKESAPVLSVAGWKKYTFTFTGFDTSVTYGKTAIFVNFGSTARAGAEWYVDDVAFAGATSAPLAVVEVPETLTPWLFNFEGAGSTGYVDPFGGPTATIGVETPAGGSLGSTKNLKIQDTAWAPWGGVTFGWVDNSLLSRTKNVATANIYAPVAGQTIKLKLEDGGNAGINTEVDVVSVQGWNKYSFNFTTHDPALKYNKASIFVNFGAEGTARTQSSWFIDDISFNGATAAALGGPASGPATPYNVRLADWTASNSFDGTHVWGDGGLGSWFPANTGYFAKYVKVGSTFTLRYAVTNATTGAAAANGTVVKLRLGTGYSGSNAKFTVGGVVVDGLKPRNPALDIASKSLVVSGGYVTVQVTSNDLDEDATENPGSATANPDGLNPLFMQIKPEVDGNSTTNGDWVNIVATKAVAAPTISSVSATSGKNGQAIDIVGTNFGDALSATTVSLYTPATTKLPAVTTAVRVIAVSADGTRLTVASPNKAQKGSFKVSHAGGTVTGTSVFSASTSATSKPAITFATSVVKEIGETLTLSGANIASSTSIKFGTVEAAFTVVNASTVSVIVPVGAVSGSKISATNAGGTTTTTKVVFQAAVITTATANGRVGNTVTVTGKNLVATAISFAGNKTAKAVVNNGTTLTFVVPAGALTGPIKITTGAGSIFTDSFTVVPPAPTVASFTPATGKKGVAVVTVKGTNLLGATVTVGSVAVTLSAGATATSFKFVIPAGASTGKINVTTAGGTASSTANLTVTN